MKLSSGNRCKNSVTHQRPFCKRPVLLGLATLLLSPLGFAASYQVDVQNLTRGTYFAPLLVAAHPAGTALFETGSAASLNLQKLAEGGDITGLDSDVLNLGGMTVANPAAGLLAPGATAMADLGDPGAGNTQLSVLAMLSPTNDGFLGLNAITLPAEPGTYSYWVNAYDAGTEANDEIRGGATAGMPGVSGMPVPAPLDALVGTGGSGVMGATAEGFVHIHRGVIGDNDATAGISDINASSQRWLNPVARVTVTVE